MSGHAALLSGGGCVRPQTVPPTFARLHMVSKLPAFFAAYPDMAVELAASEMPDNDHRRRLRFSYPLR